jgi:hypothetical protein
MKAVYGLYATPELAQSAIDGLRKAGVSERQITILSSEPLEHYEFARRESKTWMNWIAVAGAVIGLTIAYLLLSITQRVWPIDTGGMPIVSHWTNMIIMFELTMLGAIFATVATLLITAGIPNLRPIRLYDPEVSNGKILVGVANPSDPMSVERALKAAGHGTLKTVG